MTHARHDIARKAARTSQSRCPIRSVACALLVIHSGKVGRASQSRFPIPVTAYCSYISVQRGCFGKSSNPKAVAPNGCAYSCCSKAAFSALTILPLALFASLRTERTNVDMASAASIAICAISVLDSPLLPVYKSTVQPKRRRRQATHCTFTRVCACVVVCVSACVCHTHQLECSFWRSLHSATSWLRAAKARYSGAMSS